MAIRHSFFVVLAIFVFNSSDFSSCLEKAAQQTATPQNPNGPSNFTTAINNHWRCTGVFLKSNENAIAAFGTGIIAWFTILLVGVHRRQGKDARVLQRAYVFPDNVSVWEGSIMTPPIPARANIPGLILVWRNTGQTPARQVISWADIAVIEPINQHTLIVPKLASKNFNNLGANGTAHKALWFGRPLTPNEIADIQVGVKAIYLFGRIEYADIFGELQFTNFRLSYSGIFPPPPGGGIMNFSNDGNEAS